MQNVVSFKVSGAELSAYIDQIQKKSDVLSNSAIKSAIEQANKGKETLAIINQQIIAIEKKSRIEMQAVRSIALENREADLKRNKDKYASLTNDVYSNGKLSELQKKERMISLTGREKEDEEKIKNDYRENLTIAKEQERQAKIQTTLSRENIDALKNTAKENIKAITNGDMKLVDVIRNASTDEEKLVAKLTEEGLRNEKKLQNKEGGGKGGVFTDLLAVDNINRMLSTVGQITSTQNGFDMIKPSSSMLGRVLGGIIGGAIGSLIEPGVGTWAGANIGSSLGGSIGETSGELLQRTAIAKQDYYRSVGRWRGITGKELEEGYNTENVGVNVTDFIKLQTDFARRRGTASGAMNTAKDALYLDKGYGVDQSTSASIVELQRMSREGNKDLAQLIGGILQRGDGTIFKNGDHTFLNEFLGKFTSLQKELLKYQTNVASGTTMDVLTRFNKLGGEWGSTDPRSQNNINAIQASLSNPGSDNLKAISFAVLRKQNPNASIFDLLAERQKGLGSPAYLKGMLGAVESIGGDESYKKLNIAGMFPGLSLSAVNRLYQNREALTSGEISIAELKSQYKGDFQQRAEDNTPLIDKQKAGIDNSLLQDLFDSIDSMSDAIVNAIESSLSGAVIEMKDGNKIKFLSSGEIRQNVTKKAAAVQTFGSNGKPFGIGDSPFN